MVGVPLEFPNVCEMMRYMAGKHENLNIKTQVIGIAIGRRDELFPTQGIISLLFWLQKQPNKS